VKNFPVELLALATRLQELAPRESEDPKSWMHAASDFFDICMPNGQMASQLVPVIPLADQGKFLRAVKAIGAAARSYNSGLRQNIEDGLVIIIKVLRREASAEEMPGFSIHSIRERVASLSALQKEILDATWNYHVANTKALPLRSVQPLIGRKSLKEVLSGLNGSLIAEVEDGNFRCLSISLCGALLTGDGKVLANLLVSSLDLAKGLYMEDSHVTGFTSEQVKKKLGDENTLWLVRLLRLPLPPRFPFYVSSVSGEGASWSATITDNVMELYQSSETTAYLNELLSASYQEDEPVFLEERQKRNMGKAALLNPFLEVNKLPEAAHPLRSAPSYIEFSRLQEIRNLGRTKMDCTRLLVMCEELNECAARGNAHAVIMLTRAILDHVPPAFEYESFAQLAANYGGNREKSFKKAMERLDKHTKEVAHRLLHGQISESEVAPTMSEVAYPAELNLLLSELYRRLKKV